MTEFSKRILEITAQIPCGKVMSYGQVAALAGNNRGARIVGYAMHNASARGLPCHRVVFKDGGICPGFAFGGQVVQRQLLEAEGVSFNHQGKVNIEKHRA